METLLLEVRNMEILHPFQKVLDIQANKLEQVRCMEISFSAVRNVETPGGKGYAVL